MFNSIKDTAFASLTLILVAIIGISYVSIESLQARNTLLNNDITQLNVSNQALISNIESKEVQIARLKQHYEIVIALNAQHRKNLNDINATHKSRMDKAYLIKDSTDEPTKDWANALLPADAVQLLKPADCKSGDPDPNGLCATATRLVSAMQQR
jgi:cell division protein FtsB